MRNLIDSKTRVVVEHRINLHKLKLTDYRKQIKLNFHSYYYYFFFWGGGVGYQFSSGAFRIL